eukprot:g7482.t1
MDAEADEVRDPGLEMAERSDGFGVDMVEQAEGATPAERYPAGNSSAAGAIANFVNTIVGAGIVGLPFALAQSGLWAGIFMLCLGAALNYKSTTMLITAGEKVGRLNYEELMAESFGNAGIHAFCLFAGVHAFGAMSAYLVIVGDTIPEMLQASGVTTGAFADRHSVIAIFGIFCMLPVSLLKDLSRLSYTSCISVLADLLLTIIVIATASGEARDIPDIDRSGRLVFVRPTIFAGFGAISFAFVCQHSSFLVYRSMSKRGVERWTYVTKWSVSIALVMGMILAVGGYWNFVEQTEGNILNNFSTDHKPASVARGFLAVTMILTYPVEMYVARHVLDVSVFQTLLGKGPTSSVRRYWITVSIWSLTMLVALTTDDLGAILEIFGAFSASAIGYILPPLMYIKSNQDELRHAKAAWSQSSPAYEPALTERLWASRNFFVPVTEGPHNGEFEMASVGLEDEGARTAVENGLGRGDATAAERAERYPAGNSTLFGAVANFVNTIVGAGIVGLPFALAESGLWAGMFMMFLAAFLTNRSTNMLIAVGEKAGILNYEELMGAGFGNIGIHLISLFVVLLAFGAASAYLIILGDTIPEVVKAGGVTSGAFVNREVVIALFGIFAVLPLSLLKDLSKLSYTSGVSVFADALLTLIVLFSGASEASDNPDIDRSERLAFVRPTIFAGFGAISFAFVCQSSSFLVYRSLSKGGVDRWVHVSRWSVSIALVMGMVLAVGGYWNFVDQTEGNILNNFSADHGPASAARLFLAITMVLTYPMEMYVARHVFDVSVFQTMLGKGPMTTARHYGLTLGIWGLSMILAMSTDNLGSILEIFGAFSASAVGYIMPALLYLKANRGDLRRATAAWAKGSPEYEHALGERLWALEKFCLPIFMVVFGVIAMVAGVATAVVSELTPTKA